MTQKDLIMEIPQVDKVETDFHDLDQYGEYYGLIITFKNGLKWTIRMQEHEYGHFLRSASKEQDKETDSAMDRLQDKIGS